MALFARLKGGDETIAKIAVWPFINHFTLVLDGKRTIAQMAAEFGLDAAEQTELGSYLTGVGAQMTAEVTRRIGEGISVTTATLDTRSNAFARAWQALSQVEAGYMTEAELKQSFGVA